MSKSSFEIIWDFLAPDEQLYANRREACQRLWSGLSRQKQRQIYATFVWQKSQGVEIEENPYFAISHCKPKPFNYNGSSVSLPNDTKLFIAKYGEHYGVYSKLDTEAFEMEDKKAFNWMRKVSKSELAKAAGVSERTLRRWLAEPYMRKQLRPFHLKKRQRTLPAKAVQKICEHYVIEID